MKHNKISAMYRDVLKAIGIEAEGITSKDSQFWDKRIYNFADHAKEIPECNIGLLLLFDAASALLTLRGFTLSPLNTEQRRDA